MNENRELHVVFGTGPLGQATMRELIAQRRGVRMVNRRGTADVPAEVEVVAGDAYDVAFTTRVTAGATAVYQCAQPAYHEWAEKFPRLQAAILEGAAANGAKLIVGDNLYLYGDPGGRPITEDSPQNPHTKKGKVRKAMADAVLAAHQSGKVRAAIGRASNFLGEYDLLGELVVRPLMEGKAANVIGRLDQPHSFTYVEDFGRGLAILGTRDEALGRAWIVPTLPPVTQGELLEMLAREIGVKVRVRVAGALILKVMGLFNPAAGESVEMMYEFNRPFVVDSSRFEQTFGVKATPMDEVIRATVAYFKHAQGAQAA